MIHKLEADSIQLQFGQKKILNDIYIKAETGKITGFLGRNGAGKSCLMKIIYGNMPCEKSVRIDTIPYEKAGERPDLLQYLPQFNFIPKQLTLKSVFQDFELNFTDFEMQFQDFKTNKTKIGDLSGGNRRIVEIYCLLKSKAQFLMLDEPFTHINPIQIEKIKEIIVVEKLNKGIIISDHMYRHVIEICDNLYVLVNGKTHLTNTIDDIERLGYARV